MEDGRTFWPGESSVGLTTNEPRRQLLYAGSQGCRHNNFDPQQMGPLSLERGPMFFQIESDLRNRSRIQHMKQPKRFPIGGFLHFIPGR